MSSWIKRTALAAVATAALMGAASAEVVYNRANSGEPETLDTHKTSTVQESHILRDMLEGLVTYNAKGEAVPGQAAKWEVSDDGKTYRFTLRDGLKWSNGDPITAEDFVYSYRRIMDPATGAKYANILYPIKNAEKINKGQGKPEELGVKAVDETDRIISFLEKPAEPPGMPDKPDMALASMGIYVFNTRFLFEQLRRDVETPGSNRDFGKDIIPHLVQHGKAVAHRFTTSCVRSGAEAGGSDAESYWRDVGTVDAYWEANIDLTAIVPSLDLYHRDWPISTFSETWPPAKFVHDEDGRRGHAINSLVSSGCIVSGAALRRSLVFTAVHMHSHADVEGAVILPFVEIGRGARLKNVVIDRGVRIPDGLVVGEDPELDARRFRRTEKGVCLITKPMIERLSG